MFQFSTMPQGFPPRSPILPFQGLNSVWALLLTLAGSCAGRAADVPAGLTGLWEVDDPLDPGRASHGAALVIVGTPPTRAASLTDAQASPYTLTGVITTHLGLHHLELDSNPLHLRVRVTSP